MIPPSLMIDGRAAIEIAREHLTCGGDAAIEFLEDQITAGNLKREWPDGAPDPVYRITLD